MPSDVVILAYKTETKTDTKTELKSAAIIGSAFCICVHLFSASIISRKACLIVVAVGRSFKNSMMSASDFSITLKEMILLFSFIQRFFASLSGILLAPFVCVVFILAYLRIKIKCFVIEKQNQNHLKKVFHLKTSILKFHLKFRHVCFPKQLPDFRGLVSAVLAVIVKPYVIAGHIPLNDPDCAAI